MLRNLFFARFKLLPQILNLFAEFLHGAVQATDGGVQLLRLGIQCRLAVPRLDDTWLTGTALFRARLSRPGRMESGWTRAGKSGAV